MRLLLAILLPAALCFAEGALQVPVWPGEGVSLAPTTMAATVNGSEADVVSVKGPSDDLMLLVVLDFTDDLAAVTQARNALISRIAEIRGGSVDQLAGYKKMIASDIVEGPRAQYSGEWAARQVYIALGQLMLAAATLNVDTCPMEGFVPAKYDEVLNLEGTGWTTTVLCPCGYRSIDDKNAKLPKIRFDAKTVITHR